MRLAFGTDQSTSTLAPASPLTFAGGLPGGWRARTGNFDWAQTSHPVTLTSPTGRTYPVTMYTSDALRLIPGVVENGLFLGIADLGIIAGPMGVEVLSNEDPEYSVEPNV